MDVSYVKVGLRKGMSAVYPMRSSGDTYSEGEEDSPRFRKEVRYDGLGLGKPSGIAFSKTRWLMRQSRSCILSSGNDTTSRSQGTISSLFNIYYTINIIFSI